MIILVPVEGPSVKQYRRRENESDLVDEVGAERNRFSSIPRSPSTTSSIRRKMSIDHDLKYVTARSERTRDMSKVSTDGSELYAAYLRGSSPSIYKRDG